MIKSIIDYLVKGLGIDNNTAVTIVVTLITFTCGYIITGVFLYISRWIKKVRYRKSLLVIIKIFLNSCDLQVKSFEALSDKKGVRFGKNYVIDIKTNFSQNYLSSLDIKVFIDNFASLWHRKRLNEIAELFEIVEKVKGSKESLESIVGLFQGTYSQKLETYNFNINEIQKIRNDIAVEYNGKPAASIAKERLEFINHMIRIFNEWSANGANSAIQDTYTQLVNPILEISLSAKPELMSSQAIVHCLACQGAYNDILTGEEFVKEGVEACLEIHKEAFQKGYAIIQKW